MSGRITKKRGATSKYIRKLQNKIRNKNPKKVAKEDRERRKRYLANLEENGSKITPTPAAFSSTPFHFEGNNDSGMDDEPMSKRTTTRETWDRYSIKELVEMYVGSLGLGKPSLTLTDPKQQPTLCQCKDKRTKSVTLYMMGGIDINIISIIYLKPNFFYSSY